MVRNLWVNRIGESKVVNGFEFTLIDIVDNYNVMLTVDDEEHIVAKRTWNRGVFRDIVKNLDIKHLVGKVKESCGWLFEIVEAAKDYVIVKCEGYEGEEIISMNRWKKARFGKRLVATAEKTGVFKKIVRAVTKVVEYLPALITNKPISADIIQRHMKELDDALHYKEFKQLYAKLANYYHTDKGGNSKAFQMITRIYKFKAPVLKRTEPVLEKYNYDKPEYERLMRSVLQGMWSKFLLEELQGAY